MTSISFPEAASQLTLSVTLVQSMANNRRSLWTVRCTRTLCFFSVSDKCIVTRKLTGKNYSNLALRAPSVFLCNFKDSQTSRKQHPKCKGLVVAYGTRSPTRTEPQGFPFQKRSVQSTCWKINRCIQSLSYDMCSFKLSLKVHQRISVSIGQYRHRTRTDQTMP